MQLFAYPRETKLLDGTWQAIPDQYEYFEGYFDDFFDDDDDEHNQSEMDGVFDQGDTDAVETEKTEIYHPESADIALNNYNIRDGYSVTVPSSWGEEIPEFRYFEGWMWFAKSFDWDPSEHHDRSFLRFGAVNYKAKVWLNGQLIGTHEGGYTPFSWEVTDELLDGENTIVVQVDNKRYEDGIPMDRTDWYNFGGINRSVELVSVPSTFIRNYKVETSISEESIEVRVSVWLDGGDTDVRTSAALPELDQEVELTPASGENKFTGELSLSMDNVTLWSTSTPRLYTIRIETADDTVEDEVGLREVSVDGSDILLNGEPITLEGVGLHEEAAGKGRALDEEDVETRFEWIKDLGCNFARLAHYPHTEEMARKADEEGILLWEEVPAYWHIHFGDEEVQDLYRQQLRELVQRDWDRASVILWSVANETDPNDETRNEVLSNMVEYTRGLDDSRLMTAACFMGQSDEGIAVKDPLKEHLDVIGINEYIGWYYGEPEMMEYFQEDPDGRPIIISEMGGGAKWGHHGDEDEPWTEEHQARIYREQTKAIADNDQIVGLSPWILFDFRAPMRQNEHQRGYNRKGLLDQHGRKKKAFHVLKNHYQNQGSE